MGTFTNGLKTAFLLGLLMALCIGVGYALGRDEGMVFGFIFGGGMALVSYFFSAKIALWSAGAQPVTREQAPELYELTERLAGRAGLPMPRIYFSPEQAPNAFATGRGPRDGVICVTAGLMQMMSGRELEGVVAHELSHIKHRDVLISTIAAVIAGAISVSARYGLWYGGGRQRDNGPLEIILLLATIVLAPIAALLIQMGISRAREYAADASGARYAGGPEGLISALKKLETANQRIPMNVSPAQGHMYIVMPLTGQGGGLTNFLRSHPPTEKRIARLLQMMNQPA